MLVVLEHQFHRSMPTTFFGLPHELQKHILQYLQQPWHLRTEEVPTFSGYPVYTLIPTPKLEASPLLACRGMHDIYSQLIIDRFTGVLDATEAKGTYSIMPRYKRYLSQVSRVLVPDPDTLVQVAHIFKGRLPSLKTFEVTSSNVIVFKACDATVRNV